MIWLSGRASRPAPAIDNYIAGADPGFSVGGLGFVTGDVDLRMDAFR